MPGRIPPVFNTPGKIQLERLSHVYYTHTDLEKFDSFARDFGFEEAGRTESAVYYRGWGKDACSYVALQAGGNDRPQQAFEGAVFIAKTENDFNKSAALPGVSQVRNNPAPGGGKIVTLASPSGSKMYILWGQRDRVVPDSPTSQTEVQKGAFNTTLKKARKGLFHQALKLDLLSN